MKHCQITGVEMPDAFENPNLYLALCQPKEGSKINGEMPIMHTCVHKDDYDKLLAAYRDAREALCEIRKARGE